jgi:hypothetical protein
VRIPANDEAILANRIDDKRRIIERGLCLVSIKLDSQSRAPANARMPVWQTTVRCCPLDGARGREQC